MQIKIEDNDENKILEDLNIVQGSTIHLQDKRYANKQKVTKKEIDWAKMTL